MAPENAPDAGRPAVDWKPGKCNENSGFLFKHTCGSPPSADCEVCTRPVCVDHTHHVGGKQLCTTCAKADLRPGKKSPAGGAGYGRAGRRDGYYDYYDNPYFYGGYHYRGYGFYHSGWGHHHYSHYHHHHGSAHDFTEADGQSLRSEGDEAFESDTDAS